MSHIKRITRELQRYNKHTTELAERKQEQLIYYFPDEDLSNGYGLVIGPDDTPYQNCFFLVKFNYDVTYPMLEPSCKYISLSPIRQSPNLYENGKVCLSVINTWGKSTWKASKGFMQVLLSIQGLVTVKNALDCEPPYDYSSCPEKKANAHEYEEIVRFSNFKYNILKLYHKINVPVQIKEQIQEVIKDYVTKHYEWYLNALTELNFLHQGKTYTCNIYPSTHNIKMEYSELLKEFRSFLVDDLKIPAIEVEKTVKDARKKLIKKQMTTTKVKKTFPPGPPPGSPPKIPPPDSPPASSVISEKKVKKSKISIKMKK